MKIVTIEDVCQRISNKYPGQNFEIIEYTRVSRPFQIKCGQCGKITRYSSFSNFINANRLGICQCFNDNSNLKRKEKSEEQIQQILNRKPNLVFLQYGYRQNTKKNIVKIYCRKCGENFEKTYQDFLKNSDCPHCETKQDRTTVSFQKEIGSDYLLLSEYKGCEEKVLVKHKCGFTWTITPKKLIHYSGCPKCNRNMSKGEYKIFTYFLEREINFEKEKTFSWQSNPYCRYDFYLPQYNLIIEYHGKQHYEETSFCEDSLKERQLRDKIKKEEAIKNNFHFLEISYIDYKNIEQILDSWFNDYSEKEVDSSESKQQSSIIDEDIV